MSDVELNSNASGSNAEDRFELYDLRVEVAEPRSAMVCSHRVGDFFLVQGENLVFSDGMSFSMYALSALLPLLPAKQRMTDENDWMTTDAFIACPDPHCGALFKITRTRKRRFSHAECTVVPKETNIMTEMTEKNTVAKRTVLKDGYTISRVINGGWQLSEGHALGNPLDMRDAKMAFARLADEGFDTFDCADIYTGVEEFIGQVVEERRRATGKDDIRVHTKFVPDMDALADVDYAYVERVVARSLKRLRKERLDLVQFHWWDYGVPGCVDTAMHLVKLKEKGLIANIGTTNFDTDRLRALLDAGVPVVSNQTQYSLLDRRPEKKMAALCRERGIKLIGYGSLSGGFLSERWLGAPRPAGVSDLENRSLVKYSLVIEDSLGWEGYQRLLALLKGMADAKGCSVSNLASSYVLHKEAVAAVIVGTRSSRHIESNKNIFTCTLSADDLQRIEAFLDGYPVLSGEPFELERELGGKHRNIMKMNLADA